MPAHIPIRHFRVYFGTGYRGPLFAVFKRRPLCTLVTMMTLPTRYLLLIPLLFLSAMPLMAQSNADALPAFADAERRIVHNLAAGAPRYEGVTIRYAFRMTSEVGWTSADDVIATVSGLFSNVISAELVAEDGKVLLFVETDGDLGNHEAYQQALDLYGTSMARHPRTYALK